ncbi:MULTISPECIES: carbohydrate ABC transporter permease [Geodermatophilus]|jgi:cellobiose transport system permease protein|uniref:Cellobiose ABC transporter membrane protein n=2 Tax=Geodermatophilus TaxID=1860 RepID=A0A1I7CR73_9ACTN|nr:MULTISPECIES: sugar ABC transporter permease [Geodermatophilus]NEM07778.1 sugar ABC transporter permease [Geodermatophilus normandii]SFU01961.1 cellobiose ABC transporter membrane protein [Geodermatophilus amargosae]
MTIASDDPRVAAAAAPPPAPPPGPPVRRRRRLTRNRWGYAYVAPFFVLFACFSLYPFLYTAWISLHEVRLSDIDGAEFVGLGNYTALLQNEFFWNAARNTLTIGVLSTVPQLAMALGLAHLLNYKLRGRTFYRVAMLMPYATSIAAATLVFAQLFGHDYGLINTLLEAVGFDRVDWESGTWTSQFAISVIVTWRWTGYNALIYLAAMQAIPGDLYEAATLDGASRWQQFLHVTIPALKPTILFTIVVSTIGAVQLFGEPLLFSGNGMTSGGVSNQYQTLGLLMYDQGWTNFHLGQAAATAWAMFLIILVVVGGYALLARRRARAER